MNEVMVSICCLAYNHENYIRKTLEGFVNQKTNFKYEILIHDDASTDKTTEIIKEYEKKYPDLIKPIYQTENQYSKGIRITCALQFPRVTGKYVAMCEGDDFWTDMNKLQLQVDAMEANPNCTFCAHMVEMIKEDGTDMGKAYPLEEVAGGILKAESFMEILANKLPYPFQTSSYFFRSEYLKEIVEDTPQFMKMSKVLDMPLLLFYISKGDLYYINKKMSCYRVQSKGSWNEKIESSISKKVENVNSDILWLNLYDEYCGFKFENYINEVILRKKFYLLLMQRKYKDIVKKPYSKLFRRLTMKEKIYIYIQIIFPQKGKGI